MDTRDTTEQAELRDTARRLARELGPATVADLDHHDRRARLARAVRDAGWLELRDGGDGGAPVASGVEACIVAEALGAALADVAFTGPLLAADLARRAGVEPDRGAVVAFDASLAGVATGAGDAYAVDIAKDTRSAYVLAGDAARRELAATPVKGGDGRGADLTRSLTRAGARAGGTSGASPVGGHALTGDDLAQWTALGLALTSADLVGVMRGALELTVGYAAERQQYGVAIGSFQAVQHLLAEAQTLMEGAVSVARHASWAVDSLPPLAACEAARVAKAYCVRGARTVCETAIQVHGGIGNTWECLAHVYLRRALLSSQWFGDDAVQLGHLRRDRLAG